MADLGHGYVASATQCKSDWLDLGLFFAEMKLMFLYDGLFFFYADLFLLLCRLSETVSLARLDHQTHSPL